MKYFTLDWWNGVQEHAPSEDPIGKYEEYYQSVKGRLPPSLIDMHEKISLHDGELRSVEMNPELNALTIKLHTTYDGGLREVTLHYSGVISFSSTSSPEKGLPGPRGYGDWGYDEIEVFDGKLEHRILFSSGIELIIQFVNLTLALDL